MVAPFFILNTFVGMKWIGERISFVDDKNLTTIIIDPEVKGWISALMGAWVAMWYMIGAIVIWSIFSLELTDQEKIILFVFITFWGYYATRVSRAFFWMIWGKEHIKINETELIYKKSIKGYGRAAHYYVENITKIRLQIPKERSFQTAWESSPWIRGGERVEFDYMGKVIKFGRKLNEKDAQQLFKFITKKVDNRLKQRK